jgi:hypothetical protein
MKKKMKKKNKKKIIGKGKRKKTDPKPSHPPNLAFQIWKPGHF